MPAVVASTGKTKEETPKATNIKTWNGVATWYGTGENECVGCGKHYRGDGSFYFRTASGDILNDNKVTCAFNFSPLGSIIRVTNTANNKSVDCRVNDTGGFTDPKWNEADGTQRVVDMSKAAMLKIGNLTKHRVTVTLLK